MTIRQAGFIWLDVTEKAIRVYNSGIFDLYILHDDGSESLAKNRDEITKAISEGKKIGIEVGFDE
jgi:hypothetical protein